MNIIYFHIVPWIFLDSSGDNQFNGMSSHAHAAKFTDDVIVPHVHHTLFVDLKKLVSFLKSAILNVEEVKIEQYID